MDIISRSQARDKQLKYYFTGKPCKRQHIAPRMVSNLSCTECVKLVKSANDKKYYIKNSNKIKQNVKKWVTANSQYVRTKQHEYYERDKQQRLLYQSNRYNNLKSAIRYQQNNYRRNNPGLFNYYSAIRHYRIRIATPSWADLELIRQVYIACSELTKTTGIEYHVDHIIPLRGQLVSGLHIHTNLQIIPKHENLTKRNTFIVD